MSLKDEIAKEVWATILIDQDRDQDRDQAAARIIALVRVHLTSEEAVGRGRYAYDAVLIETLDHDDAWSAALLAALGDTHD